MALDIIPVRDQDLGSAGVVPGQTQWIASAKAMWARHGVLAPAEIERRAGELLMVAVADGASVVGVSTTYLATPRHLGLPMWVYRMFVDPAHRGIVAVGLWAKSVAFHEAMFVAGSDQRGRGMYVAVQHAAGQEHFTEAVWPVSGLSYVGPAEGGGDGRVRYFRGARIR